ncbi:hypothetical protein [Tenacibaculum crassostreae]|uniref:hypothetical protein n=1 Tax=Tenacibaculum crassostreae TaxID=502683 RepID=UPI003894674D
MWIRKFLFVVFFILFISSPFTFIRFKLFQKRVRYIEDYRKIKVKVDSINQFAMNGGVNDGNVKEIFYFDNKSSVKVDEDAKNGNYKHFLHSKQDSIYIWYNPKADDLYTTKDSKPLSLKHQKYLMYRDLCFLILGVILTLWFIYIMFIEKKKINE